MKLKLSVLLCLASLTLQTSHADTQEKRISQEAVYRIQYLEGENNELKKKIGEIEKNSRSVEQFKYIFELHEQSISRNDFVISLLSIVIGVISIAIPIGVLFWNRRFMKDTQKELEEIERTAKNKIKEYENQVAMLFSSIENANRREREEIAKKSSYLSIDTNNHEKDIGGNYLNRNSVVSKMENNQERMPTDPSVIRDKENVVSAHDSLNVATMFHQQGKFEEAILKYDEIINNEEYRNSKEPKMKFYIANAYYNKGVLLSDRKEFDSAIKQYDSVIENYDEDVDFNIKFTCVRSYINKLSLLLIQNKYSEAKSGYEKFINKYSIDDNGDIKLAIARAYYNYLIAVWKEKKEGYLEKFVTIANQANEQLSRDRQPFEIQWFLSQILNLLVFVLGEENKLDESIREFRKFVLQFSREQNPNIIYEIEKSFNDQIDLFSSMKNFNRIVEICDVVLENLQVNPKFQPLRERAEKIKTQVKS